MFKAATRVAPEKADFRPALLSRLIGRTQPESVMKKTGSDSFEIPQNVVDFMKIACSDFSRFKEDEFSQFMWSECCGIESPHPSEYA